MTYSKSVQLERCPNLDKGSTYGITSRWFGHYSFQRSQGSCGLGNSNRTKVLCRQITILSLRKRSIIKELCLGERSLHYTRLLS